MIVFAIDVGLQVCGFVICETRNTQVKLIEEGEIKTSKNQSFAEKLNYIYQELRKVALRHKPQALVLEKLYSHHKHPTTLGILAQVRGVAVLLSQHLGVGLFEYAPTRARKAFLGKGSVNSSQVKKMAENMTGKEFKSEHTADAFSLVAAFSNEEKMKNLDIVIQ